MHQRNMRLAIIAGCLTASGCTIAQVDDETPFASRPVTVSARNVAVFNRFEDVAGRYVVIDKVFVRDDGEELPRVLESNLRMMAGARGANAIVLAPTNRQPNGTRVSLEAGLENPFKYYSATAIWIGNGKPPVKVIKP